MTDGGRAAPVQLASLMLRLKPHSLLPRPSSPLSRPPHRHDAHARDMLPTTRRGFDKPPSSHSYLAFVARRYFILILAGGALLFFLGRVFFVRRPTTPLPVIPVANPDPPALVPAPLPPLYFNYHNEFLRQPQHHWERTRPAHGENFFLVAGHARGPFSIRLMEVHVLMIARVQGRAGVMEWRSSC